MDRRYDRVRNMITAPEVPRLPIGGIALCKYCQRSVHFAGGFLKLLARDLEWAAVAEAYRRRVPLKRR